MIKFFWFVNDSGIEMAEGRYELQVLFSSRIQEQLIGHATYFVTVWCEF